MKRIAGGWVAVALAAALSLSACAGSNAVDQTAGGQFRFHLANPSGKTIAAADRKKVADFSGTLINGGSYRLAQDAGKVVVINFWASWCGPCQVETPAFDALYRKNRAHGVNFVGIDIKDARSPAQAFIDDHHISYPIVYDEPGQTALELGNLPTAGLPFTLVVDRQQRVAAVYVGPQTGGDLQPVLDQLAAQR